MRTRPPAKLMIPVGTLRRKGWRVPTEFPQDMPTWVLHYDLVHVKANPDGLSVKYIELRVIRVMCIHDDEVVWLTGPGFSQLFYSAECMDRSDDLMN